MGIDPVFQLETVAGGGAQFVFQKCPLARIGIGPHALNEHEKHISIVFDDHVRCEIRLLQRAVGVAEDGVLGPKTFAAINAANPLRLVARFNGARLAHLASLPTWQTFGRGWALRVADNLLSA